VPYIFAMNPVMLFEGVSGPLEIVLIVITSLIGIFGVSSALQGYIVTHMNPIERILAAAGGLLLIDPNWITDIIGVLLISATIVWQILKRRTNQNKIAV
jgi:TRAP-type uncharacterized transport system fused permease subunit